MANGDVTDRERGLLNRGLTGSVPAWGTEAFRFVKPDGTSYTLEFKGGTAPARWTAQAWANYHEHKLISENPRATYERPLSPPPLVQAQPVEPTLSPPPLVQADPIKPKMKDSKKAAKATPRETSVTFDDEAEIVGYRLPKTAPAATPWAEDAWKRAAKDLLLVPSNQRYSTFELKGPEPPSRVPKDAVAYWLSLHKGDIVQAERKFRVSRIAIAGIIAWEALVNPQVSSYKAVGPGKMHLEGEAGQLSWPDVIEGTGRMRPLFSLPWRRVEMAKPDVAINYIAAALDVIAEIAEQSGWNIRNHPEILGQVYHGWTAERWEAAVKAKTPGAPFEIVPGMIGKWTQDHSAYLEAAVGAPEPQ